MDTNSEDSRGSRDRPGLRQLESLSGRVRGAASGSPDDLSWVIEQLSPLMVTWAQMQLGTRSGLPFDPEDIVHDVWVRTLPALGELHPHPDDGRMSSGLLALLRTALLHRIVDLKRQEITRRTRSLSATQFDLADRPASSSGPVQRAVRSDHHQHVLAALSEIPPRDRELYVRKIFEGMRLRELMEEYGMSRPADNEVRQRVRKRLEGMLTSTLLDDLEDD